MLREIVENLLHNLGGRSEVDRYLAEYRDGDSCTVVKVGGGLIADDLDELATALALIHHVGLRPVVIHGAGPQLTTAMEQSDIQSGWKDGLRVTTPEVLSVAAQVFQNVGIELSDAIESKGAMTRRLTSGVFKATPVSDQGLGLVGEVTGINSDAILNAIERDRMPILAPLATTSAGQLLNINADTAARAMAQWRCSRKVLFLTPTGGILDSEGRVISAINCEVDLDELLISGSVSGGMARKLIEIRDLLDDLEIDASVSITSPDKVARELFTHKGSGTLVRRGTMIVDHVGTNNLDLAKLNRLLERSFAKTVVKGFADSLNDAYIHLGGDYIAVAIVRAENGIAYLDKLALGPEAQGIGLGIALWSRLKEQYEKLYWRSKPSNPANKFYLSRADGMYRNDDWLVFWCGLVNRQEIEQCIDAALKREATFQEEDLNV